MKTLFTSFKGINNTSFRLIKQIDCDALLLTNSFEGLKKDIRAVNEHYDTVYMFGVDKNLVNEVRIETCADYDSEIIYTDFDIDFLQKELTEAKINFTISRDTTKYLCNAAFYHMLKVNSNTVFIHIPSVKGMSEQLTRKLICFCLSMRNRNL